MSDATPPTGPTWLTYHEAAERLGIRTPQAAKARARRGKWPKRIRNDTGEAEVAVPAELLAAGPQKPQERRRPPGPALDAGTIVDAVRGAVAPLQGLLDTLVIDLKTARATNDALRSELAAAQAEAAELRGKSAANEAALERETADRKALQHQADNARAATAAAEAKTAELAGKLREAQQHRSDAELAVVRLRQDLQDQEARREQRRRWWRFWDREPS